jgi:tRNA(Arg) A34 adenosine deaminase TadA
MSNLDKYTSHKVGDVVSPIDITDLSNEIKERHQIFCLLNMALTHYYWNGNKYGRDFTYPRNPMPPIDGAPYLERDYFGHNISALAVDSLGQVIDFDFNHNDLFHSTIEHAEARLIRRIYSLAERDTLRGNVGIDSKASRDRSRLTETTIYTSLESCAQCSGIMTLANIKEVVYFQIDPGQYGIGNFLWRMTEGDKSTPNAPRPIAGNQIDLIFFEKLNQAYEAFTIDLKNKTTPFAIPLSKGESNWRSSITSFLCTESAFDIFYSASQVFRNFEVKYPGYQPTKNLILQTDALTNQQCFDNAKIFFKYATERGFRGTSHL